MQAQLPENITWGFVLVRCTYLNEERWLSFLSVLRDQQETSLPDTWHWTAIEDKDNLNGAAMSRASDAFQAWTGSTGSEERPRHGGSPRYNYFIYINEESIYGVLDASQQSGNAYNFLVLVDFRRHLNASMRGPSSFQISESAKTRLETDYANHGDDTWKLIDALQLKNIFLDVWMDRHGWYGYDTIWNGPPYIFYRFSDRTTEHILLKNSTPSGLNVYRMMKQIYGTEHPRSICFQNEQASTTLQRLRGYKGGDWVDEFPEYC